MLVPVNSDSTRLVRRCRFTSEPGAFRLLTVPVALLWGEALTARRFILDSSEESSSVPNAQSTLRDHGPSVRHADRPSLVQAPPDARRDRHVRHCHGDRRRGSAGNRQRRRAVPAGDPREDRAPFDNFTVPGWLLGAGVSRSAAIPTIAASASPHGTRASVPAGAIMMAWIIAEAALAVQPRPTAIEGLYFGLGAAMVGLACSLAFNADSKSFVVG